MNKITLEKNDDGKLCITGIPLEMLFGEYAEKHPSIFDNVDHVLLKDLIDAHLWVNKILVTYYVANAGKIPINLNRIITDELNIICNIIKRHYDPIP